MIKFSISKNEIAEILGVDLSERNKKYIGICTLDNSQNQSVLFIKKVKEEQLAFINKLSECLIITQDNNNLDSETLVVDNTRLAMAKVLNYISRKVNINGTHISDMAYIHPKAQIGENVKIGAFAFIDENVIIGDNSQIKQGAKILKNTVIGNYSIIRENSVVGGQGFGVEKDGAGTNLKIAHLGGVVIGNHVEVGALNTIVSGTINPTIIADYVKIDDHVHIAHNCKVGKNTIITAGVVLSGSVTIGANVWVGPNSTVKNSIAIDKDNLIGIGTVITKDILGENKTYAGVPGKAFGDFINDKKAMNFLVENLDKLKMILKDIE